MKMKRIAALSLTAAILAGTLTACGSKTEAVSYTHLDVYKRQGHVSGVYHQCDGNVQHCQGPGVFSDEHESICGGRSVLLYLQPAGCGDYGTG